jgi:glycosyltransferase involved in cell wall biosynthesis
VRIAQIAPPWIPIPPKHYGGTENVIYHLVEEQVAQGHDVTLFASDDSKTPAKLVSFYQKSLLESGVPWSMHLKAFYHLQKAVDYIKEHKFDIVYTHLSSSSDMYLFPLTAHFETPHVTTLHSVFPFDRDAHSNRTGDADSFYMEWAPFFANGGHQRECSSACTSST